MANLLSIKQRFGIIGNSPLLDRALSTAVRVSNTDLTVLITGESGVGKEVFSKIIHQLSPRKHNNFIAVNCGAIPAGTINSELFGHDKGAFTGATSDRKGYFETVDGGTIFLDEIGEMPLDTQSYLLRILESGEYLRVGSSKVQQTDVRIIAATNVALDERVRKGKFRDDLYYRLNTVPILVPALKDRREDIPVLFRKFTVDFAEKYRTEPVRLSDEAIGLLRNYRWPGNIRELKNIAEQLSVLAEERYLSAESLLEFMPKLLQRNLPALVNETADSGSFQEREILYKLLFDMKKDLNDLKGLVFDLIQRNNLAVPELNPLKEWDDTHPNLPVQSNQTEKYRDAIDDYSDQYHQVSDMDVPGSGRPIILDRQQEAYGRAEVVEENLSLEEMEKDLIQKALRKHKGRRKDAAIDLGISERTLYRKIKEYEL
ncbi:MAG: sigma-54-dependent Fis family transcriptional regulator [Saprospiraceae bacterium]|nr:sigma-54-dependent Fis family transcriptional regulator [Saprospiraceae bacterium]